MLEFLAEVWLQAFAAMAGPLLVTIAATRSPSEDRGWPGFVWTAFLLSGFFVVPVCWFVVRGALLLVGLDPSTTNVGRAAGVLVLAPLVEEHAKVLLLLAVVLISGVEDVRQRVLLGLVTGLGFAGAENFIEFHENAQWTGAVADRFLGPTAMHGAAGIAAGALGKNLFGWPAALAAAIVVHALFNWVSWFAGADWAIWLLGFPGWILIAGALMWALTEKSSRS